MALLGRVGVPDEFLVCLWKCRRCGEHFHVRASDLPIIRKAS